MKSLNRRSFLHTTLAGGALAAASSVVLPARAGESSPDGRLSLNNAQQPLNLSIMSYAFHGLLRRGMIDMFGYLESSKYRYNLNAVHLWSGYFESTDEEYLLKIKEALDERELHAGDLAVDGAHVWVDEEALRERHHKNALAYLNAARILEVPFVRIDAGGNRETMVWTNEEFDHIVKRFREYADYAQDHGFKVGAENHWGPERSWENYQKLYHAVDHPAFGLSCHIGAWEGSEEERDKADRECAPWVCSTHIDWRISTGPHLKEKLANLWNAGYEGYYSVEHHSGKDEYREVEIQLALVRNQLERFRDYGVSEEE